MNFSTCRYIALIASVEVRIGSPKRLGRNKFVRTKSPIESKFSKIFFEQLYVGLIVAVHLYCGFSLWRQMAPQHSAKFRTAFFRQFRTSLRKVGVANYASIWALFPASVTRRDALCNALNSLQIRLWVAPQDSQNCSRYFAKHEQSTQSLRETLRMVVIDIVINHSR